MPVFGDKHWVLEICPNYHAIRKFKVTPKISDYNLSMSKKRAKNEKEPVKDPKSDLFTTVLLGDPKNESLLLSYINGVFLDAGKTPIVQATVQNPFNVYARSKYAQAK